LLAIPANDTLGSNYMEITEKFAKIGGEYFYLFFHNYYKGNFNKYVKIEQNL